MKQNVLLTIVSLLAILLGTLHLADDIARGMSPGGRLNLYAIAACTLWLYGAVVLAGKRSGLIINLLFSLLVTAIPAIHMRGAGMGYGTNRSNGLFFVWTILALGITGLLSALLTVRALLTPQSKRTANT